MILLQLNPGPAGSTFFSQNLYFLTERSSVDGLHNLWEFRVGSKYIEMLKMAQGGQEGAHPGVQLSVFHPIFPAVSIRHPVSSKKFSAAMDLLLKGMSVDFHRSEEERI
jgi:hypothetical protein